MTYNTYTFRKCVFSSVLKHIIKDYSMHQDNEHIINVFSCSMNYLLILKLL